MGETTGISWTDATFNGWMGCARVSTECDHCYAEQGSRRLAAKNGLKLWDEGSTRYVTSDSYWRQPLSWNRKAAAEGVRRRVFCSSYADVFEDRPELVDLRKRLFDLIASTPWLDWQLLTKRPQHIDAMLPSYRAQGGAGAPWPNVWLGTTCGVVASLERVELLVRAPRAVVKFVSVEPLIEPLSFGVDPDSTAQRFGAMTCSRCAGWGVVRRSSSISVDGHADEMPCPDCHHGNGCAIDWVIVGGESGAKARPFDVAWARALQAECRDAGPAFFAKQLGARPYDSSREILVDPSSSTALSGNTIKLKDSHGGDWDEWPESLDDLKVREFPDTVSTGAA